MPVLTDVGPWDSLGKVGKSPQVSAPNHTHGVGSNIALTNEHDCLQYQPDKETFLYPNSNSECKQATAIRAGLLLVGATPRATTDIDQGGQAPVTSIRAGRQAPEVKPRYYSCASSLR